MSILIRDLCFAAECELGLLGEDSLIFIFTVLAAIIRDLVSHHLGQ